MELTTTTSARPVKLCLDAAIRVSTSMKLERLIAIDQAQRNLVEGPDWQRALLRHRRAARLLERAAAHLRRALLDLPHRAGQHSTRSQQARRALARASRRAAGARANLVDAYTAHCARRRAIRRARWAAQTAREAAAGLVSPRPEQQSPAWPAARRAEDYAAAARTAPTLELAERRARQAEQQAWAALQIAQTAARRQFPTLLKKRRIAKKPLTTKNTRCIMPPRCKTAAHKESEMTRPASWNQSPRQRLVGRVHAAAHLAGLATRGTDRSSYEAALEAATGKRSCSAMTNTELHAAQRALEALPRNPLPRRGKAAPQPPAPERTRAQMLDDEQAACAERMRAAANDF